MTKRILDLVISFFALFVLFPFLLIVFFILRFTGEGEIFYRQKRLGYKNKEFFILKFATMVKNSPNIGTGSITTKNDPRVLPFGRILRKSKINELPQIFNVIMGQMSIVGPRPQMKVDFEKFPENLRNLIYRSKPGITGVGSIIFRDEESLISKFSGDKHLFYKKHIAPYKTDLELWYYDNSSFFVDLILIFLTAWYIIQPKSNLIFDLFPTLPKSPDILNNVKD